MDKCSNCYIVDRAKLAYCPDCKKVKKTSKGKWIATGRMFIELNGEQIVYEVICDSCNGLAYFRRTMGDLVNATYCPRCGMKMGGQKWID